MTTTETTLISALPPLSVLAAVPPLLGSCTIRSGTLAGLEFQPIDVEVASRRGPSAFQLAGLAEAAVREARIRVTSAVARLGIALDEYALTVSLAPADVKKSGSGLDVPLALSVLGAVGHVSLERATSAVFFGELSLDGGVRPLRGVLPLLQGARRRGVTEAFVPLANAAEASHLDDLVVRPVAHLTELVAHLRGERVIAPLTRSNLRPPPRAPLLDLLDVRGQAAAKRALEVAAAGIHNLLLVGPPGAGKSLLAQRLPGLLPPLGLEEALETTAIHSVAGLIDSARGIVDEPPFRSPHHSVSEAGLVGGGSTPRPGEISLAHHGVLFLDELPEFRRSALESLRQPLEEGRVHLVRVRSRIEFPARPLLVAAMNPCACGHHGDPTVSCRCSRESLTRYRSRLSGPLLDRIDLQVTVPQVSLARFTEPNDTRGALESTTALRQRVERTRAIQLERFERREVRARHNGRLSLEELERVAAPDKAGKQLLLQASERIGLSARGYVRVLRLARTLADLEERTAIGSEHVGEAIAYRLPEFFGPSR